MLFCAYVTLWRLLVPLGPRLRLRPRTRVGGGWGSLRASVWVRLNLLLVHVDSTVVCNIKLFHQLLFDFHFPSAGDPERSEEMNGKASALPTFCGLEVKEIFAVVK